jgi:hypothetical protein
MERERKKNRANAFLAIRVKFRFGLFGRDLNERKVSLRLFEDILYPLIAKLPREHQPRRFGTVAKATTTSTAWKERKSQQRVQSISFIQKSVSSISSNIALHLHFFIFIFLLHLLYAVQFCLAVCVCNIMVCWIWMDGSKEAKKTKKGFPKYLISYSARVRGSFLGFHSSYYVISLKIGWNNTASRGTLHYPYTMPSAASTFSSVFQRG